MVRHSDRLADDNSAGAFLCSLFNKFMTVKMIAYQRDKQASCL